MFFRFFSMICNTACSITITRKGVCSMGNKRNKMITEDAMRARVAGGV